MLLKLLDPVDPILPNAPLSGIAVATTEDEVETPLPGPELEPTPAPVIPPEGRSEMESWPRLKGLWSRWRNRKKNANEYVKHNEDLN